MATHKESQLSAADQVKKNSEEVSELKGLVKSVVTTLEKQAAYPGGINPSLLFGPPGHRNGEDSMSSRGFSFMKAIGLMHGYIDPKEAKTEMDISNRLIKSMNVGSGGYEWGGNASTQGYRLMVPLGVELLPEPLVDRSFRHEIKSICHAGVDGSCDLPDNMQWVRRKMMAQYGQKDLSWLNELTGGALVAPPEMGELIQLLRNKEALINAGARVVPLPPQGRLKFPRQTSASTAYWIGENTRIPQSEIGTGDVTLTGKKLAVLLKAPNELIRFASPAAEALMRDDMTKTLALGLDLAGLEGLGGDTRPRGVLNLQNINTVASSSPGADGDQLVGQDVYRMIAAVEESNAEFEGWIMRPKTLLRYYQLRTDAVAQGDKSGPFLFNLIREAGMGLAATIAGYPVTKSTQVSQSQTKGSGTGLTYILGGMWSDLLIGMFGALEFAATTQGDTAFQNDQTWVRGILTADVAARRESAFVKMDNLIVTGA